MELSIVIPVYNEEENVEPLIGEIEGVLAAAGKTYEIIAVDDGSKDRTFILLRQLHGTRPRLKIVRLKRNFGQTAAMAAGLAYAEGEIIIVMDGDGQNDPADIPELIKEIEEGNDLVAGWRSNRQDSFFSRRLPSMIANRLISWTTRVKLHDYGCTLKAMRKDVAKSLRLYGEMHRFIPAIAYERGAQIVELKVNHRPRLRGKSKYGINRTLRVVLDLLTVKFLIELLDPAGACFRPARAGERVDGICPGAASDRAKVCLRSRYRQPAAAVARDIADFHRLSVRHHGIARRNAGADLSRVTGSSGLCRRRGVG